MLAGMERVKIGDPVDAQDHGLAVTLNAKAEAVILDFVDPIRASWNVGSCRGQAELKRLKHQHGRYD
jgi:hypothetical protein